MELKDFLKAMVIQFFIIYTCSMFGTLIFCFVFEPDTQFGIDYFAWMIAFSIAADLPFLIYYSKNELTEKQYKVRAMLHILVLEAVLLTFARFLDMYDTFLEGVFFAGIVLAVYIIVKGLTVGFDKKMADTLNKRIQEIRISKDNKTNK